MMSKRRFGGRVSRRLFVAGAASVVALATILIVWAGQYCNEDGLTDLFGVAAGIGDKKIPARREAARLLAARDAEQRWTMLVLLAPQAFNVSEWRLEKRARHGVLPFRSRPVTAAAIAALPRELKPAALFALTLLLGEERGGLWCESRLWARVSCGTRPIRELAREGLEAHLGVDHAWNVSAWRAEILRAAQWSRLTDAPAAPARSPTEGQPADLFMRAVGEKSEEIAARLKAARDLAGQDRGERWIILLLLHSQISDAGFEEIEKERQRELQQSRLAVTAATIEALPNAVRPETLLALALLVTEREQGLPIPSKHGVAVPGGRQHGKAPRIGELATERLEAHLGVNHGGDAKAWQGEILKAVKEGRSMDASMMPGPRVQAGDS